MNGLKSRKAMGVSCWRKDKASKPPIQPQETHTLDRAPSGPLSANVFLQFKQVQVLGLHRRPALKQSQYRAMHLDFGQLQPVGLSWRGPSSSVAEHNKSSLSNLPSSRAVSIPLTIFVRFAWRGELSLESLERFPSRLCSVGDTDASAFLNLWSGGEGAISLGIVIFFGITTTEKFIPGRWLEGSPAESRWVKLLP